MRLRIACCVFTVCALCATGRAEATDWQSIKVSAGETSVKVLVAKPAGETKNAPILIVTPHGPAGRVIRRLHKRTWGEFEERGYVVAYPRDALRNPAEKAPGLVRAIADALAEKTGADAGRVGVAGAGRGGKYALALAASDPEGLSGVIAVSGVPDEPDDVAEALRDRHVFLRVGEKDGDHRKGMESLARALKGGKGVIDFEVLKGQAYPARVKQADLADWMEKALPAPAAAPAEEPEETSIRRGEEKQVFGDRVFYLAADNPVEKPGLLVWCHPAGGDAGPEFRWWRGSGLFGKEWILAAPQSAGRLWSLDADAEFVTKMLREVVKTYNVDHSRIVIGGHSSGAVFTYSFGLKFQRGFSALLPACGLLQGEPPAPEGAATPVYIYHSENDKVFAYEKAKAAAASLEEAGYDVTLVTDDQGHSIGPKVVDLMKRVMKDLAAGE